MSLETFLNKMQLISDTEGIVPSFDVDKLIRVAIEMEGKLKDFSNMGKIWSTASGQWAIEKFSAQCLKRCDEISDE